MTALPNSRRLRMKIELVLPQLSDVGRALFEHPRFGDLYPEYLFTLHCMIRASVPLMRAATERAAVLAPTDPTAAEVTRYLSKHIQEEMDHDNWLLDDLEVLGWERADVLERPPGAAVATMVGAQYYWIYHYHPIALLGYVAVMEGYPPTTEQLEELRERSGHDRKAFRTLMKHAHLDPHHRDDLNDALDALDLSPSHSAVIGMSAVTTVLQAATAFRDVLTAFEGRRAV